MLRSSGVLVASYLIFMLGLAKAIASLASVHRIFSLPPGRFGRLPSIAR